MQYFVGFDLYLQLPNCEMAQCYILDILKSLWRDMYLVQEYNAKLSDFGIAKDGPEGDHPCFNSSYGKIWLCCSRICNDW